MGVIHEKIDHQYKQLAMYVNISLGLLALG